MKTFQYIFGIIMLIATTTAYSQHEISGRIEHKGQAVPFATVVIKSLDKATLADEDGYFILTDLPTGEAIITASFIGYKPKRYPVTISSEVTPIVISLEIGENSLAEVVVTGTMQETYVKASPIKVDVVTAKRMETYLPTASTSIMQNLTLVNGVQEVVACGVCYTNEISINGLPGQYTAVLMDGTPIYGNLASVYGLNGIPNQIIDRFEVIKGPSSTLYGSEAVAGVINIITKDPKHEADVSADIMGTSHLESFGNISATPQIGNSHGFVGVNYAYINDFDDVNNDGFGDGINLDRVSLFSKWNVARQSDKLFTIAGKYYYEDRRNGVEQFVRNRNYQNLRGDENVYGESIYTNRAELFGTYELPTKENLKIDYSFSAHDQDSFYGSDNYDAEQKIAFANFIWNKDVDAHKLLVGSTFRYSAYDDNTIATQQSTNGVTTNNPSNQFIPGVFAQDEWQTSEKMTLLGGLRLDHYDSHGFIFAPRLSAKYNVSDYTTLRTNFGTGFRVVNLFTEDHAFVTGQREVEILEELKPEESYNGSINLNHEYANGIGTGRIEFDGFYTYFTNKINPNYDEPTKIIYENTNGHAKTRGGGVNVTHNFSFPVGINVGANWQKATQTEDGVTSNIEFAPRFTGVGTLNYFWEKADMTIGYTANFTGKMQLPEVYDLDENGNQLATPRATTSEPFSVHTMQAQKQFTNGLKLYVGVQNLTNFRQNGSPLVGFNDPNTSRGFSQFFDTSYAYAPNHGREGYVGVKWEVQSLNKKK